LSGRAIDDLKQIQTWVAEQADIDTARAYVSRIEAKFLSLNSFPLRGTPRDDLIPGLRTIPFERRLVIAYRLIDNEVWVERIVSAARDNGIVH
jgi:toxin ParE1/3/4